MKSIMFAALTVMSVGFIYYMRQIKQVQVPTNNVDKACKTPVDYSSTRPAHAGAYITQFSWGHVTVEHGDGTLKNYKDVIVYPEGSQEWDWSKTGTRHVPGIQVADVQELAQKVDRVILSRGVDLVLQVQPETLEYLRNHNKQYDVLQSQEAVELYNKLISEGKRVGIVLHSTC